MFSVIDFQTVYSTFHIVDFYKLLWYMNLVIGQLGIDKELSAGKCVS